ncbi:acyl-CoA synthetase (AMP-forming)/AMP-acid ligase II [Actinocorallia herbida]|uniref:Acyl-CoA synthetase (AMP-forming)/AMP-acid ligase II n=1 Tax=Actinocorallia herbida TaxID=58109 RepID=A0A3N1CV96_9ACTN|nr:fatty acid--CoA ligase family protein [Actinocorallia herbida]ROO85165.1 acyl-CoA synthetase (AMP-forming)/AMP-acid ligase II [Actinocorallia herbida]
MAVVRNGGLAARLREVIALDPAAPAIEFAERWWSWGEVAAVAEGVAAAVPEPGAPIGVILRNTPEHVGALLGVLLAEGCAVTVNPGLGDERTRADLAAQDLTGIVGTAADLARFAPAVDCAVRVTLDSGALGAAGAVPASGRAGGDGSAGGVPLGEDAAAAEGNGVSPSPWTTVGGVSVTRGEGPVGEARPGVAVRMLTSGTTGPPKRVDLGAELLLRTMAGAKHYEAGRAEAAGLRRGVAVVNAPLVHLGGLFRVVQCVLDGRSFVLLPGFEVTSWAAAVRRHRPRTASLVPAALRMVLDSDLTRADLASLKSVMSGTAPLDPADAEAFTARFGVPVLTSYAATEFGGGVAGWNLADHREFGARKRGSVGRAHAGCGLRVVAGDGTVLPPGETGLLEVRPAQFGPGAAWVRTTDLARLDEDGFLWIVGRADQAIIRGGFKVHPDQVRAVLERHPSVRAAAVLGVPDPRLGEVPVAVVETRPGHPPDPVALLAHAADHLARYELPARVEFVTALPRTASRKVDLPATRALLTGPEERK